MPRTYWQVMAAVLAIGLEAPQVRALWYLGSGWHRTTAHASQRHEGHLITARRPAVLVGPGLGSTAEHALISLLALNGLRVSEATGADIEHLGLERGHRTLTTTRKGGKVVTIPLAPRTARAIDLALGERTGGSGAARRHLFTATFR